ncbi:MAG TPA: S8 family serine peptidase [Albitalea sp.]
MRDFIPHVARRLLALAAVVAVASHATAQIRPTAPASRLTGTAAAGPATVSGKVEVVVKLSDAPLAVAQGASAKQHGALMGKGQAQAYLQGLRAKQDGVMTRIRALGGVERARVSKALNAVVVSIEASQVATVAQIPGVASVRAAGRYELDLTQTVPYIGAAAAQAAGKDGAGVRVAVLDSGIDYTHWNLGGPGTVADYAACYAQKDVAPSGACAAWFGPAATKVVGGYDFVGELWPSLGDRSEDPNPIDFQGHGTHVADIIAGRSADGAHKGVAPGASLYAVKVCSAVATSCNGVALLKAMDFALDPNGDGDISDAVDVVNMSLGSSYGQKEDDLSEASANAVRYGVVVVASAGNSADRPYIVGSPSSTPGVISVAQTQVPGASSIALVINSPANIAGVYSNTATIDWAPVGDGFTGDVAFVGRGCNADSYLAPPSGKVALIDRGACNISEKVRRASDAGAIGVLIGLVAPGDASTFSNGGDCPVPTDGTCKPSLVITQADSNRIKANITAPVNVSVSNAVSTPLAGSMVASSSRGPSFSYNAIKPDIGAPGASVSAIAGTGMGTEAFGGTSGAAPMVSGAAAILVQAFPNRAPAEIKAALMNTAETTIYTSPATLPGVLAPITRIGAGEVRVDRALASTLAAWDTKDLAGSLSFGHYSAIKRSTLMRSVTVRNYGAGTRRLSIAPSFRYADDAASGAVNVRAPASISVPGNGSASFNVQLSVDASKLPAWTLNGGSQGGNGPLLQSVEFDGYLTLSDASGAIKLPWHVLPQKSSDITPSSTSVAAGGSITLANAGAAPGIVSVFSLTGTSGRIPVPTLPHPGDNYAVIDLKAVGVRASGTNLQFAIHTFGERAHPNYPAEFDIYIDTTGDGTPDFVAYNLENGGFAVTGQNVVGVVNLNTGASGVFFFTGADLNSANAVMTVPMSFLGITAASKVTFSVYAFDNYFTGNLTDAVENMTYTPGTPRFTAADVLVPAGGSSPLTVQSVAGGDAASPSQSGLLLFYSDGKRQNEAQTIAVTP